MPSPVPALRLTAVALSLASACSSGGGVSGEKAGRSMVSTFPSADAIDVPVEAVVAIIFSSPLGSLRVDGNDLNVTGVDGTVSSRCSAAFFEPAVDLAPGTRYTVNLGGDLPAQTWSFTTVASVPTVVSFASGENGPAFAVRSDGTLWSWTTSNPTPARMGTANDWAQVVGGSQHASGYALAIKTDGTLWGIGANGSGQLGNGRTADASDWTQSGTENNWATVAAGRFHSLGLKTNGTLWAWGEGGSGELGVDYPNDRASPVQTGDGKTWRAVTAGNQHTVAIRSDGTLWVWGSDSYGALGLGDTLTGRPVPTQVGTDAHWSSVAASDLYTIASKTDGTLWAWGRNFWGQLGLGNKTNVMVPTRVGTSSTWGAVAAGYVNSAALGRDGSLWMWGSGLSAQLGDGVGATGEALTPQRVGTATDWRRAVLGRAGTLALKADGTLWGWGATVPGGVGPTRVRFANLRPLVAPTGVSVTAGVRQLTVSWDAVPGATSYDLHVRSPQMAPTDPDQVIACVSSPAIIPSLTAGVTYTVTVVAADVHGDGPVSAAVTATPNSPSSTNTHCAAFTNRCGTVSGGIEWMGTWVPKSCSCPRGLVDQGGSHSNELCGLSGAGHDCKYCTCP